MKIKTLVLSILAALTTLLMTGCSAMGGAGATGGEAAQGGSSWIWIIYIVFFIAIIYFMSIRPQKKEKAARQKLMDELAIGDCILTNAGFYGTIIDMTDDTVIVEFGNNKNCRIPMQKASIVQVEKPEQAAPVEEQIKNAK